MRSPPCHNADVKRPVTILLVVLLAVLLPLRAIASVSIGLCAAAQQAAEQGHDPEHGHGAPLQHGGEADGAPLSHGCSSCAEHCTGVSFVPSPGPRPIGAGPGADLITSVPRLLSGIVPGQLERPPLGS